MESIWPTGHRLCTLAPRGADGRRPALADWRLNVDSGQGICSLNLERSDCPAPVHCPWPLLMHGTLWLQTTAWDLLFSGTSQYCKQQPFCSFCCSLILEREAHLIEIQRRVVAEGTDGCQLYKAIILRASDKFVIFMPVGNKWAVRLSFQSLM